jgi:hypothetical protein
VFEEVVHPLEAVGGAERHAELLESPHGQGAGVRQAHVAGAEVVGDPPRQRAVARVPRVVGGVLRLHPPVRRSVHVLGGRLQRRKPARDEGLPHTVGGDRQVVQQAETAEALAQHAPRGATGDATTDQLGIGHDRVRAEQRKVLGLRGRTCEPCQALPIGR